jgi:hypothetical protein
VHVVPSLVESGTVVQLPDTHAAFLQGSVLAGHAVPQLPQFVVVVRLVHVPWGLLGQHTNPLPQPQTSAPPLV